MGNLNSNKNKEFICDEEKSIKYFSNPQKKYKINFSDFENKNLIANIKLNLFLQKNNIEKNKKLILIKEALNCNETDKNIVSEYLKFIKNLNKEKNNIFDFPKFENEIEKYKILFTSEETKNLFGFLKEKSEKEKYLNLLEKIFKINTNNKKEFEEFLIYLKQNYNKIIHFNFPIDLKNKELFYYKNYCLILEQFNYLKKNNFKIIELIKTYQKYEKKIKKLLKIEKNLNEKNDEKLINFIFLIIYIINYDNFINNYYRVKDCFIDNNKIIKKIKKFNNLNNQFNINAQFFENKNECLFNFGSKTFIIKNFSFYSPNLLINNLNINHTKNFGFSEEKKLSSLNFYNYYNSEFYKKTKEKIYKNFNYLINSPIIKKSIKILNNNFSENDLNNFFYSIKSKNLINKFIEIYPFENICAVTDKYILNIYFKGILNINNLDNLTEFQNNLKNLIFIESFYNILFIHEFCSHFIIMYFYYLSNKISSFYTPIISYKNKKYEESGIQHEFLLFDRELNNINFSELVYICNKNSYKSENIEIFRNNFVKLSQSLFNDCYDGNFKENFNEIKILINILENRKIFNFKNNLYEFEFFFFFYFYRNNSNNN